MCLHSKVWIKTLLLVSFLVFVFSCFLGWYRTSGEGRAPRGQRPQPSQYSGHHHSELISPSSVSSSDKLLCFGPLLSLWSICVSVLRLFPIVHMCAHASLIWKQFSLYFLFSSICLSFVPISSMCQVFRYFVQWHSLFCFCLLCCHTLFCSSIQVKVLYLKLHLLGFLWQSGSCIG